MPVDVIGAAGGATASLYGAPVGGFTLTLPTLGIKCVLCRHIESHLASDGSLDVC